MQCGCARLQWVCFRAQTLRWCCVGLKSRFLGQDNRECTVEELALQHYASTEGGCWQGQASALMQPCNAAFTALRHVSAPL